MMFHACGPLKVLPLSWCSVVAQHSVELYLDAERFVDTLWKVVSTASVC